MDKKYLVYIVIPIVIGLALIYGFFRKDKETQWYDNQGGVTNLTIEIDEFGFSFTFPDTYIYSQKDIDIVHRIHKVFILTPSNFIPPKDGEGSAAITIDVYQNNLDKQSIESWIKGNSLSNYKLGDGVLTSTLVDGKEALAYDWDGLYRGHTVVFEHNQNIIAVSVTYLEVTDQIRADYDAVLKSFKFINANPSSKLPQTLIESYFKENISKISLQKEVLGGKFYITNLVLNDSKSGVVNYEDGHIALVADFTYSISPDGKITIDSFIIRK